MKTKNIDLGKYDLNQLLRNPGIIHQIQDNLLAIKGGGILEITIRHAAKNKINECIEMIIEKYKENPDAMLAVIGMDTLILIDEFSGERLIAPT